MKTSQRPKFFNQYKLQNENNKNIKTCGRWCIMRCLFDSVPVEKFAKGFLGQKESPDKLVTEISKLFIGK